MSAPLLLNPTSKQIANRQARIDRFEAMMASLPATLHPSLVGKELLDTSTLFRPYYMDINKFRHLYDGLEPVSVQRDHIRREERGEVDYLFNLHLTHVNYVVVVPPSSRKKPGMGDGNTRTLVWFVKENIQRLPSHVSVLVYFPDTDEICEDVYNCIDAAVNAKRTRHDIQSCYRDNKVDPAKLVSSLVRDGHWVSAGKRLARVHSTGPITGPDNRGNLKALTKAYLKTLGWLDGFELSARQLHQGFVTTGMLLHKQQPELHEDIEEYVLGLLHYEQGETVGADPVIRKVFKNIAQVLPGNKRTGETAIDLIFAISYLAFPQFLMLQSKSKTAEERKRLAAAAASFSELPPMYLKKLEKYYDRTALAA